MVIQLEKCGDDYLASLDPALLKKMGVNSGTVFKVTTNGVDLTFSPVSDVDGRMSLQDALRMTNEQFAYDLKKLAE